MLQLSILFNPFPNHSNPSQGPHSVSYRTTLRCWVWSLHVWRIWVTTCPWMPERLTWAVKLARGSHSPPADLRIVSITNQQHSCTCLSGTSHTAARYNYHIFSAINFRDTAPSLSTTGIRKSWNWDIYKCFSLQLPPVFRFQKNIEWGKNIW